MDDASAVLLCRVRELLAAIPLRLVVETMRPLPIAALSDDSSFVLGIAIIRGQPTPVVDAGRLVGCSDAKRSTRFVVVRVDERRVALAVESVIGTRTLEAAALQRLPPLLGEMRAELVTALGKLDSELLVVLEASRAVSEAWWSSFETGDQARREAKGGAA